MNSFNVYGQTTETIGGNTPVWLGTVKPIPRGGYFLYAGKSYYPAGTPIKEQEGGWSEASASEATAYLYNDVVMSSALPATCAIVMYHPEGLLIDRVGLGLSDEDIETLQANIPGVLLVRG